MLNRAVFTALILMAGLPLLSLENHLLEIKKEQHSKSWQYINNIQPASVKEKIVWLFKNTHSIEYSDYLSLKRMVGSHENLKVEQVSELLKKRVQLYKKYQTINQFYKNRNTSEKCQKQLRLLVNETDRLEEVVFNKLSNQARNTLFQYLHLLETAMISLLIRDRQFNYRELCPHAISNSQIQNTALTIDNLTSSMIGSGQARMQKLIQ